MSPGSETSLPNKQAEKFALSIDVGTTGLKFGVYSKTAECRYFMRRQTPLCQKPLGTIGVPEIYQAVLTGIKEIVSESGLGGQIEVIGIDGQMGGFLGADANWEPVIQFDPPINNNYKPYMHSLLENHGREVLSVSGSMPINGSKVVYWMNEQPEIFEKVKKIMTIAGFITGKMAGLKIDEAFIDYTSTYLFALGDEHSWSGKVCSLLGIPEHVLPAIKSSTEIIGALSEQVASRCGLRSGIPIIAGSGDTASSIFGTGIYRERDTFDIAGTCSIFGICSNEMLSDIDSAALWRMKVPLGDAYYYVGVGFGGEVHAWFLNNIFGNETGTEAYQKLVDKASAIPAGSENLLFFPFLGGSFSPPKEKIRGTWLGMDWQHTSSHMYRAVLEAIGFEYYYFHSIFEELEDKRKETEAGGRVIVSGGGRSNMLWNRIKADILGMDYVVLDREDHENAATAMLAAAAAGMVDDPGDLLRKMNRTETKIQPVRSNNEEYRKIAETYLKFKNEVVDTLYSEFNL